MSNENYKLDDIISRIEIRDSILSNMGIAIYVSDMSSNKILYVNMDLQRMYKDKPLIGKICWVALYNKDKRCSFCPIPHLLKNPGKRLQWELSKEGQHYLVCSSIISWPERRFVNIQYMMKIIE